MGKKWLILGTLTASLAIAGVALAALNAPSINRWVIGSGGGSEMAGGLALDGTIGQWIVGSDESGAIFLGHGFWGGGCDERYAVYLPIILSNFP